MKRTTGYRRWLLALVLSVSALCAAGGWQSHHVATTRISHVADDTAPPGPLAMFNW